MNRDQELLNAFIARVREDDLHVNYVQIRRGGEKTAEYQRLPEKTRLNTWSACKGVVSCAAGIAQAEGLIRLDEKIIDIFPEYAPKDPGPFLPKVTLEHLLTMTSGLENPLFFGDSAERYVVKDWIQHFFNASFDKEPGSRWMYSNFNTYMVSCAIEKRAGVNLLHYLHERFFDPLGIHNPDWTLCPMGHVHAANGLYVTIDELANYTEMIKNFGKFEGKQIVPYEYMKRATSKLVDNSYVRTPSSVISGYGYGYQFLMTPEEGAFRSSGKYGQLCLAYPQKDVAITIMSLEGNDEKMEWDLWETVVPFI